MMCTYVNEAGTVVSNEAMVGIKPKPFQEFNVNSLKNLSRHTDDEMNVAQTLWSKGCSVEVDTSSLLLSAVRGPYMDPIETARHLNGLNMSCLVLEVSGLVPLLNCIVMPMLDIFRNLSVDPCVKSKQSFILRNCATELTTKT